MNNNQRVKVKSKFKCLLWCIKNGITRPQRFELGRWGKMKNVLMMQKNNGGRKMSEINKHEILMIRACKICDNEKSIRRLKKIMRTHYLDDSESVMLHWLFELALMIYPNDMHWAFTLGRCESWRSGEDGTFNQIATRQLISKIRLTKVVDLPKGFIPALRFRKSNV